MSALQGFWIGFQEFQCRRILREGIGIEPDCFASLDSIAEMVEFSVCMMMITKKHAFCPFFARSGSKSTFFAG